MPMSQERRDSLILRTIAEVAECVGRDRRTVTSWIDLGMPREEITPGIPEFRYRLDDIFKWYDKRYKNKRKTKKNGNGEPDDELLFSDADSPNLERYRAARASLAEMELKERRSDTVRVAEMRATLLRLALLLRKTGETLLRRFGVDAADVLNRDLLEFDRMVESELKSEDTGDPSDPVDDSPVDGSGGAPVQPVGGGRDNSSSRSETGEVSTPQSSGEQDMGRGD